MSKNLWKKCMRTICCSWDSIVYSVWNDHLIVDQVTAVQVSSCNADRRHMLPRCRYLSTLYTHNVHNKVKCIGIIRYIIIWPGAHTWRPLYKHVCEHGDRGDVQESYYPATASTVIIYYIIILYVLQCVVRAKSSTGFVIERHA